MIAFEKTFRELYNAYFGRVYLFLWRQTDNRTIAEDITQQVFIKLWECRTQLPPEVALDTQLFQIARSALIDYYRAETSRQKVLAEYTNRLQLEDEQKKEETESRLEQLRQAIDKLPPRRREIFQLSRREGLTYEEIAEELSISKHTVHVQISRALFSLRSTLAGWFF